jgi:4-amino-4-deoxy-L-arabinose transferase-like glycosyltransferase
MLTIVLFVAANLPWELESFDQAKQAFVSWQMVRPPPSSMTTTEANTSGNHFLYQQTPAGKVATKPPLVGWVSAVLYEVTRSWDMAWRLPSLIAGCAIAWLLWRRAGIFGSLAALISLAAFSLNLLSPRLATLVRTDMPLALVAFLIALLFFEQIRGRASWGTRERTALFLLLAASMLIKGPIVYAFVLPAMVLFVWRYRGEAVGRSVATGWWPWIASLAIFVAWVVGGVEMVPRFYNKVVLREFVGRFGETFHRPQPIFFYLPHLLHKWAPWSLLLIALLLADYRSARLTPEVGETRRRWWRNRLSPELFWLLAWGLGGLIVMSCIPSKRVDRIFPVVPPLCLLLGGIIGTWPKRARTEFQPSGTSLARWCAVTSLAAVIFASSYAAFKIVSGVSKQRDALVKCGREFRTRAAENRWRYGVLKTSTEALVFYLDVPSFTSESEAVQRWNAGELDAVIGSERRIRSLLPELGGDSLTQSDLCQRIKGEKRFIVVQRRISP